MLRKGSRPMKRKRRKSRRGEWIPRSGYTTDKTVSLSKVPKGPGPGAEQLKSTKKE